MVAVRHLEFVMCVFGPPTKGIWWSLSLCKIWLESMPIHAPKMVFLGGDLTPKWGGLSHRDPQKALMVAETRRMSH